MSCSGNNGGDDVVRYLVEIARQGRGVQIHVAVATQPTSIPDNLQQVFATNFARLVMGHLTTAERQQQKNVAMDAPTSSVAGRGLFEPSSGNRRLVQVPLGE